MRRTAKIVSVLDIGSTLVRMGVYQMGKTGVQRLDLLEVPLRLGHEVFTYGRISPETVRALSAILRGFTQVMREYGVTEYRAIATTALREAENRTYVLDQLKTQNNLSVEVLEDAEESGLVYSALLSGGYGQKDALLSYIGTGSIGAALYSGDSIRQSCNITVGFLKISEILRSTEDKTTRFYQVMEEYIDVFFQRMSWRMGPFQVQELLITGRELDTIAALCGAQEAAGVYTLKQKKLQALYDRIKSLPASAAARLLDTTEETADQVLPMLALYLRMMEFAGVKALTAPRLDLMDILAGQLLDPAEKQRYESFKHQGALSCARELCRSRELDMAHAERVLGFAVALFQKLKKLHGVSEKRLVLLECAALLHEIGYGLNAKDAAEATYDTLKQTYLYGLTEEETALMAEIARYGDLHRTTPGSGALPDKRRLLTDKLAAILNLANTLDESRKGKVEELKVKLEEDRLILTVRAGDAPLLEQWAFEDCAPFFENVFGIQPVLIVKSRLV